MHNLVNSRGKSKILKLACGISLISLTACSTMEPKDFDNKLPALKLEEYFSGDTKAWGVVHDRFGKLRREFTVDIFGEIKDEALVLTEDFVYSDGEKEQRIWHIKKIDEHNYQGTTDDIRGVAVGESYGNALHWSYSINLKLGDDKTLVHFNDWMYLQPDGVLINKAVLTKWGFRIAEISIFFKKSSN